MINEKWEVTNEKWEMRNEEMRKWEIRNEKWEMRNEKIFFIWWCIISKLIIFICPSQPANCGPQDVPRTSPPTSPGRPLKILFDRAGDVPIWRPNLTSWGRPEMTSRGRLNLTFKGRRWEVDSGCPQDVLRTSPRGPSEYSNLDVPAFF